jgi:thioredoxin-like negative regulator of GroEL
MFEKMRKEGKLPANVIKVDVEEHPKLAERYRLDGVPAIMLFVEGKPKAMTSGLMGDYAQTVRRFTRMVEGGLSPD